MPLTVAVQMNPVEGINIETDTTFLLMLEAQARGHGLWVYQPERLQLAEGRVLGGGKALNPFGPSRATTPAWAPRKNGIYPSSTWC